MKTKYSISILKLLSILFLFASCEKDDLDTWVTIEADKTTVAVDSTVTFKMSGNAETYVVYTGDASHDFTKSYLVITGGRTIDDESYVLTQAKLDIWIPILTTEIAAYNITNPNTPLNANVIITGLQNLVEKSYYKDTAAIRIRELMPTLKTFANCQNLVVTYFTNLSVLLTPPGGFSTGVAINRYNLTYSYKFTTPGTYVVTLLGTRIGDKIYSGSGYIYNSTASASEYNFGRNTATVTIVVQ
ncbi:hypothetical protein FBBAL38_11579 [Flavobacteria bacterium BAL38]|nr:hypothetical protein FBBAL38_11579 [Flavobacteria bacterium BAL38]